MTAKIQSRYTEHTRIPKTDERSLESESDVLQETKTWEEIKGEGAG